MRNAVDDRLLVVVVWLNTACAGFVVTLVPGIRAASIIAAWSQPFI